MNEIIKPNVPGVCFSLIFPHSYDVTLREDGAIYFIIAYLRRNVHTVFVVSQNAQRVTVRNVRRLTTCMRLTTAPSATKVTMQIVEIVNVCIIMMKAKIHFQISLIFGLSNSE